MRQRTSAPLGPFVPPTNQDQYVTWSPQAIANPDDFRVSFKVTATVDVLFAFFATQTRRIAHLVICFE
jgi:heme/copper-type cytochrome/quinol oxidase subunit 2